MSYQGWYHCMGNTFGTWPPGDDRGWRSYKHREHCEGDYENPPPPRAHKKKLERATLLMKRPPVLLMPTEREIVCLAMAEKLIELGAEVIDCSMTNKHFHVLARFDNVGHWISVTEAESRGIAIPRLSAQPELVRIINRIPHIRIVHGLTPENTLNDQRDPLPRHLIGLAKKHASHTLRQRGHLHDRGIFAKRCKLIPIEDGPHLQHVIGYIPKHIAEGGAVFSLIAPHLITSFQRDSRERSAR